MNIDRIRAGLRKYGLHGMTSNMLKQAGEIYPEVWNLKTAALAVTLKMAQNREIEHSVKQGLASFLKVI
jgi:hypothetical protein